MCAGACSQLSQGKMSIGLFVRELAIKKKEQSLDFFPKLCVSFFVVCWRTMAIATMKGVSIALWGFLGPAIE
jgi:hypothetical protein